MFALHFARFRSAAAAVIVVVVIAIVAAAIIIAIFYELLWLLVAVLLLLPLLLLLNSHCLVDVVACLFPLLLLLFRFPLYIYMCTCNFSRLHKVFARFAFFSPSSTSASCVFDSLVSFIICVCSAIVFDFV